MLRNGAFLLPDVSNYANRSKADLNFSPALMNILPAHIKATWKKKSKSISLPQPSLSGRRTTHPQQVVCKAESEKL
jgi:hypothetical protein